MVLTRLVKKIAQSEEKTIDYLFRNISLIFELMKSCTDSIEMASLDTLLKKCKTTDKNKELTALLHVYIDELLLKHKHTQLPHTEINKDRDQRDFIVLIANSEQTTKLFTVFLSLFYHRTVVEKDTYLTLDFEFNKREIALMQLCFQSVHSKYRYIWITSPAEFPEITKEVFVEYIMRNKHIHKLLHGADSLDIPFLFEKYFENDVEVIKDFTAKYIDTRFLCEYYRESVEDGKKCAIYDALKYFDTISEDQYQNLNQTHDGMGPVQDISWNIHTMDKYSTKYAYYDVLFLKKFIHDIYSKAKRETPQLYPFYVYLPVITRFVILERRSITRITPKIKEEVDKMNNYFVLHKGKRYTMINMYNYLSNKFNVRAIGFDMELIMKVNYFRTQLSIMFKKIVYYLVAKHYSKQLYQKKDVLFTGKVTIKHMFDQLDKNGFHKLVPLLDTIRAAYEKRLLHALKK